MNDLKANNIRELGTGMISEGLKRNSTLLELDMRSSDWRIE